MQFTEQDFKAAMGRFATGVTVATAATPDGGRVGITVSSFTSLSLNPPLVLFCLDKKGASYPVFTSASGFAVHILSANQQAVGEAFAKRGQGPERWQGLSLTEGPHGAPLIAESLASIACRRHALFDGGDHTIVVGQVEGLSITNGQPLLYWQRGWHQLAGA